MPYLKQYCNWLVKKYSVSPRTLLLRSLQIITIYLLSNPTINNQQRKDNQLLNMHVSCHLVTNEFSAKFCIQPGKEQSHGNFTTVHQLVVSYWLLNGDLAISKYVCRTFSVFRNMSNSEFRTRNFKFLTGIDILKVASINHATFKLVVYK